VQGEDRGRLLREGQHRLGNGHLSPLTEAEKKHIKPRTGPVSAVLHGRGARRHQGFRPERSRAGKQVVRKAAKELTIKLDPAVKKYNVALAKPSLHDMTTGDWERVLTSLEENYGLKGLTFDYLVLKDLQDVLRKANGMQRPRSGWTRRSSRWSRGSSK